MPFSDLIVLAADNNIEYAIRGILSRPQSLGIRKIQFDIFVHPYRDPGCANSSREFLTRYLHSHSYAISIFDKEGSGKENLASETLINSIEDSYNLDGWNNRAKTILLEPELEIWVWKNSIHLIETLGWTNPNLSLWDWLRDKGYLNNDEYVPKRPKEALEAVLRYVKKPRSSSFYYELATRVSLRQCNNSSFVKLRALLQQWFRS